MMKMSDIKIIHIVAGPGTIACDFEDGELTVWMGAYTEDAPRKARLYQIPAGLSGWSIEDKVKPT